ncbi:hypothetical protein KAW18_11530 [candidate division WOR-3 bacterium]|nr:hypothetical protein [candidate division WOR-3 bacterium]
MPFSPIIRANIYDYYLKKYKRDRIKARSSTDEVFSYIKLYGKHILEVEPPKRIPKYCFGQLCFETVSRKRLFESIYPEIADLIEKIPIKPPVIERYVLFDIMLGMYYKTAVEEDLRLIRRVRNCSVYEHAEHFDIIMKEWVKRVTERKRYIEAALMEEEVHGEDLFSAPHYNERKYGFKDGIKITFQTEEVLRT